MGKQAGRGLVVQFLFQHGEGTARNIRPDAVQGDDRRALLPSAPGDIDQHVDRRLIAAGFQDVA